MKSLKILFLIFILLCFLIAFLVSCTSAVQKNVNPIEKQNETPKITNIYFNYPVRDYPIGKSDSSQLYWECSDQYDNYFGNYLGEYNGLVYNGFHPGEDWNLKGGKDGEIDNNLPVYSIGIGKVVKISDLGSLGYLVVIEHDGNCIILSKEVNSNDQKATYDKEVVNKIYSLCLHITNLKIKENDAVDENTILGYIMNPGGGSHLHFEIRKNNDKHDSSWSLIGEDKYWQKFPGDEYNGYYKDLQKMIDTGLRDPSDFIEANKKDLALGESNKNVNEDNILSGGLVFASDRNGKRELYKMDSDGSNLIKLTDNDLSEYSPIWSPDGEKIAFGSSLNGGGADLYIMDSDGSNLIKLTDNDFPEFHNILFSPDWKKIAIETYLDKKNPLRKSEICVANLDGSNLIRLTYNDLEEEDLQTWSPDGKKIAFLTGIGLDNSYEIFVINLDGSNLIKLIDKATNPAWSPDGNKIVFISYPDNYPDSKKIGISIMNSDGNGIKRLIDINLVDPPIWSPDGNKIAFSSYIDDGGTELFVMDSDGSNVIRLTNNIAEDWSPVWSPDSNKIAFESNRDGNWEIYVINSDGSGLLNLTNNNADDWTPSWY